MNNLPSSLHNAPCTAEEARNPDEPPKGNNSRETHNSSMPHMHSPARGEKRVRTDVEVDGDDSSTEPEIKLRRTEAASDVSLAKETKPPEKSLLDACKEGDLEVVKAWCAYGVDWLAGAKSDSSPLLSVCSKGYVHILTYLLGLKRQDITEALNQPDAKGYTPLVGACFYGQLASAKLLVKAGADPLVRDAKGLNLLDLACKNGRSDVVAYLLSLPGMREAAVLNQPNGSGHTPLAEACLNGHLAVVKLLIENGGARFDQCWTVRKLLQNPAAVLQEGVPSAPQTTLIFNVTVLDCAIYKKKYDIAAYLIQKALTPAVSNSVPAIPYHSPTDLEHIDILNHTALLSAPLTAPAHGLASTQPSLGQPQWLTQLVNHQFAVMPAAQGWQQWLRDQGVSAFIVSELASVAAFLPVLSQAMAGSGRQSTPAQQRIIVASLLIQITDQLGLQSPFTGKGLSAELEARFNTMFKEQVALLRQSAEIVLKTSTESHMSKLLALCMDCLTLNGTINRPALDSLLTGTIGLMGPNAQRIAIVFEEAVNKARQRGAIAEHLPAAFLEGLQAMQDEDKAPPGFVAGFSLIQDETAQTHFFEVIFAQWRAVCLAQGVTVKAS